MPGEAITTGTEAPTGAPPDPPPVPFLFGIALWIPAFAVVLWFMMRILGPRPAYVEDDAPDDDDDDAPAADGSDPGVAPRP